MNSSEEVKPPSSGTEQVLVVWQQPLKNFNRGPGFAWAFDIKEKITEMTQSKYKPLPPS